ncbi:MAG: O-antigen ligase family protein [Verrucomicrobiota bacterium]
MTSATSVYLTLLGAVFGSWFLNEPHWLALQHALLLTAFGLVLVVVPPKFRLPLPHYFLAAVFVLGATFSFLPATFFDLPEWRERFEIIHGTTDLVHVRPKVGLEYWVAMLAFTVGALGLSGHRLNSSGQAILAFSTLVLIALYAVAAMVVPDDDGMFGFFPNRNHTATLLSIGCLLAVSLTFVFARSSRWVLAGIAGVLLLPLLQAAFGHNISRAAVVLTVLGTGAWFVFLGRAVLSYRTLVSVLVLGGLGVVLFAISETSVKDRLTETVENLSESQGVYQGQSALDFRVKIFADTIRMALSEPWTGVGLGNFRHVFPQYRDASLINRLCLHPESDWLFLLAEAGIITVAAGGALLIALILIILKASSNKNTWPLRLGLLIAGLIVPFHGLFDVPGHRAGITLLAVILLCSGLRGSRNLMMPVWARHIHRAVGVVLVALGVWLSLVQINPGNSLELQKPAIAVETMKSIYEEALVFDPESSEVDPARKGLEIANEALAGSPLDPDLHYFAGAFHLFFEENDALSEAHFEVEQIVEPNWTGVPLRQASAWSTIDPIPTRQGWVEALRRASRMRDQADLGQVVQALVRQASNDPERLYPVVVSLLAEEFSDEILGEIARSIPKSLYDSVLPTFLTNNETEKTRKVLERLKLFNPEMVEKIQ